MQYISSIYQQLCEYGQHAAMPLTDFDSYIQSLMLDVQNILNTRAPSISGDTTEFDQSILMYGMQDLTSFNPESNADQDRLGRHIQQLIERYETRLTDVSVESISSGDLTSLQFYFNIYATCRWDNDEMRLAFNSVLRPIDAVLKIRDYHCEQ